MAVVAIALFAGPLSFGAGWAFLVGAALLIVVGVQSRSVVDLTTDMVTAKQAQTEDLQQQLEQQRRSVDALADGLDIAIFILDARAHILYANRRACELFRFTDPIGRTLLQISLSYDLEQVVLRAAKESGPQKSEFVFTYPGEWMGVATAWASGVQRSQVFLSVYEVTDLRRLERVRQDFVANVSHELRTPMTLIRAMAETLLDETDADNELGQRYLGKIIGEVDRLSMISQDLLILSAAESNPVRKHSCDLADVVKEIVGQLHGRAGDKGIDVSYEGPDHLRIHANSAQMTQVAINLIENAINYTQSGWVRAEVLRDGDNAVFSVSDSGIGIAVEQQKRVFERFYRVDKGRSRTSGGTGLGLSIVKHIVEAHGGTVTLQSALNHGSTFTATLPIDSDDETGIVKAGESVPEPN